MASSKSAASKKRQQWPASREVIGIFFREKFENYRVNPARLHESQAGGGVVGAAFKNNITS
ncbi:MAG: hypothetical protein ABI905_16250 [Betaproteobacteria bacterium]